MRGIEGRSREEAVLLQETVTAKTKQCERLQKNVWGRGRDWYEVLMVIGTLSKIGEVDDGEVDG